MFREYPDSFGVRPPWNCGEFGCVDDAAQASFVMNRVTAVRCKKSFLGYLHSPELFLTSVFVQTTLRYIFRDVINWWTR
jgi:hypothetical protein